MTELRADQGWDDEQHVRALAAIARAVAGLVRAIERYRDVRRSDPRERSGTKALRQSLPPLITRLSALVVTLLEEPADPPS